MDNYLELMGRILNEGEERGDRTGVGTLSLFGEQLRFSDVENHFPLLTTKEVWFKGVAVELIWFLRGCGRLEQADGPSNLDYLHKYGVKIWDMNVEQNDGVVGPVYGEQWRMWEAWVEDHEHNAFGIANVAGRVGAPNAQVEDSGLCGCVEARFHILGHFVECAIGSCHRHKCATVEAVLG